MAQYTPPLRDMQFVMHEAAQRRRRTEGAAAACRHRRRHHQRGARGRRQVRRRGARRRSTRAATSEGCTLDKATHEVTAPEGLQGSLRAVRRGRLAGAELRPGVRRPGPAAPREPVPVRDDELGQPGLDDVPRACRTAPTRRCTRTARDEQKATYLPKLTSGEWTGTMCLTEPHCGTDLGLLRTKAEPLGRRHLQASPAARSSSRPASTTWPRTSSTWCWRACRTRRRAPRASRCSWCPSSTSTPTARSASATRIYCGGLEHKMGIHGNATAQINLDGAIGTLVGEPNKGLAAMFVMMNAARLGVGMQSLGLTEVAYQNAVAYAKDRIQMRSLSGAEGARQAGRPDHRAPRRAQDAADRARLRRRRPRAGDVDDAAARQGTRRATTTTCARTAPTWSRCSRRSSRPSSPTTPGSPPRTACRCSAATATSREWGMEQFVRDARINMIYEGTNTIQSLDLLGRKVLGDNGAKLKKFGKLVRAVRRGRRHRRSDAGVRQPARRPGRQGHQADDRDRHEGVRATRTRWAPRRSTTCASCGHLVFAYFWARMAKVALEKAGRRRSVLQGQAGHRALLLRQAAARDGDADPHRARRLGAADGDGRGAVLIVRIDVPGDNDMIRHTQDPRRRARPRPAVAAIAHAQATPAGLWKTIDDETKKEKSLIRITEAGGVFTGKLEKLLDPAVEARRASATSAPTTARTSRWSA